MAGAVRDGAAPAHAARWPFERLLVAALPWTVQGSVQRRGISPPIRALIVRAVSSSFCAACA